MKREGDSSMIGFLIALCSGALMSIQGVLNAGATKQSGVWLAAGFVQITAFVFCGVMYLCTERETPVTKIWSVTPKYLLLGGILGALITITVVKSISLLGTAHAELLIVCSQIIVAYVIELLGLFGSEQADFQWKKMFGIILFLVGIVLFKK